MENNVMMPENLKNTNEVSQDGDNRVKLRKGYKKSEELLNFANQKLEEIEKKIGMQLNGFSELYDNMSEEDQKKFIELMKASEEEQYANVPKTKHPNTRKKKKAPHVKHGNRKKKK